MEENQPSIVYYQARLSDRWAMLLHDGRILLYIREDVPSKLLFVENENQIEGFLVDVNVVNCSYNPYRGNIANHISNISKSCYICTSKHDNLLFLGDFNVGEEAFHLKNFSLNYNLTSMANKPTCLKNHSL